MTIAVIIKNTNVSGYFRKADLSLSGEKHNLEYPKLNRDKGSLK